MIYPTAIKAKLQVLFWTSMTWSQDKGFNLLVNEISKIPETVGWINFTNSINQTGWSYLEIKTNENFPDKIQVSSYKRNSIFIVTHSFNLFQMYIYRKLISLKTSNNINLYSKFL